MKNLLYLSFPFVGFAIGYLCGAFNAASFDVSNWDENIRFGTTLWASFLMIAGIVATILCLTYDRWK